MPPGGGEKRGTHPRSELNFILPDFPPQGAGADARLPGGLRPPAQVLFQGVDCSYHLIYNLLAPKGTAPAIIEAMCGACQKIVEENPDFADAILTSYGEQPYILNSEDATAFLREESDMCMAYADIFRAES